jgi:hypothetical protein
MKLNGAKQSKPENQFAKARLFIENTLRNGAVPAVEIMQLAEEHGISMKTLNRAKSALGIISVKRGGQWYWEIPIDVVFTEFAEDNQHSQDSQDGHIQTTTSLTSLTALTILNQTEVI